MSGLWIYLLAYLLLLAYGMAVFRWLVRRDYQQKGGLSVVTSILQALVFFIYGGFPYLYLTDWPKVHVKPPIHVLGTILMSLGLGFLFYGMFSLGVLRSLGRDVKHLKQAGLYRISRNPQAIACALYVIGFAMLWPSWFAAGWVILYFILIHTMILTEEEHLLDMHGSEYMEYSQQVPRYLWPRKRPNKASA